MMRLCAWLVLLLTAASARADFQVLIDGTMVTCPTIVGYKNDFRTSVTTVTTADNWVPAYGNVWDLKYERTSATTANGGRCSTGMLSQLSGDGTFKARINIHSSVPAGSGVFTIGLMPSPYQEEYELDLVVVNVEGGQMHSGRPHQGQSFNMNSYLDQWIDIIMVKNGGRCSTTIAPSEFPDKAVNMTLGDTPCALDSASQLHINSRGQARADAGPSKISVAAVAWISQ